ERQRNDVEEEHVATPAREDARLDARPESHDLVRVDVDEGRSPEERLHLPANERDARGAAHGDHLANVRGAEPGVFQSLATWTGGALDEIRDQRLELCPGDGASYGSPVRQSEEDVCPLRAAELLLRLLRSCPGPGPDP